MAILRKLTFQAGYTLIELIVVIALIGLMTGASIAGFNTLNQKQIVTTGGKELASVLRTAQNRAVSGIKPTGVTCTTLLGYRVTGTANGSAYSLDVVCNNGGAPVVTTIKTYNLPVNITFSASIAPTFGVLTAGVSGSGDMVIRSSVHTYTIRVNATGDITDVGLQ
jgi:prepilin-type N-terminal cleavage/methylation domain-containing protein